ncbi:MAG: hypothetical protein E7279_04650 [Lachnospiraceae bacterium]|nr:hypothetical protein [Lachnospiraceae bacterium]
MSYENARNGIGKIFTAQILAIIAAVCTLIAGIMAALMIGAASAESMGGVAASGIGGVLFTVGSYVLILIAFILELVGLNKAGKDSEQLKKAFTITIVSIIVELVIAIITSFTGEVAWVKQIGDIVASILALLVTYNVLYGCAGLKSELTDKANSVWKMYLIVVIISIVLAILGAILGAVGITATSAVISIVLVIVDFVLDIVAYFMYLSFLKKAKDTL